MASEDVQLHVTDDAYRNLELRSSSETEDGASSVNDNSATLSPLDLRPKNTRYILCLGAGFLGLQGVFTVFFGSGNFYLASLGFNDTVISMCWLAGPVAGLLFQPYVGMLSDCCTSRWGRRRPFVAGGSATIVVAMVTMAWAKEIAAWLSGIPELAVTTDEETPGFPLGTPQLAVQDKGRLVLTELHWDLVILVNICLWTVNLAIQPVQMGLRSLIVDLIPGHQQMRANAWAARLTFTGNIIGFYINSLDLTGLSGYLGRTQFQILCSLVSINLAICIAVTCCSAAEVQPSNPGLPVSNTPPSTTRSGLIDAIRNLRHISSVTRSVCLAQFFSWLAWFPFLFYTAKYVSELVERSWPSHGPVSALERNEMTHSGSFAMLIFASSQLVMGIILPLIVRPSTSEVSEKKAASSFKSVRDLFSLRRIWMACQILFFFCMMSTFLTNSPKSAWVMVAVMGVVSAGSSWIPYTVISKDIRTQEDDCGYGNIAGRGSQQDMTATIMGIHNMAIAGPQVIAALGSGLVFLVAGPGVEVWLLRTGGCAALAAAWAIRTLPES